MSAFGLSVEWIERVTQEEVEEAQQFIKDFMAGLNENEKYIPVGVERLVIKRLH